MLGQRNLIVILLALLMGAAAVFITNGYFSGVEKRNQEAAKDLDLKLVIVARVPLAYGDVVTADKVRLVQWPASSMPEGSFNDIRIFASGPQRVALRPITVGEPVLASKLAGPGGRATISSLLPKDKRAVALRVSDVAAVGGFVLPGDSVDVLVTRQEQTVIGGATEQITDLLVENVRVIAVDQNSNEASKDPVVGKTVTVEVDPVQAQKIALAGQVGTLSLTLRNTADRDNGEVATVGLNDLRADAYPGSAPYRRPVSYAPSPAPRRTWTAQPRFKAPDLYNVKVGKGLTITTVEVLP